MIESVMGSVEGFDWDAGNISKNWEKHRVSSAECEEVFFNEPYFATEDVGHSRSEQRFYLLGTTNAARRLFVVFMIRHNRIRVISARDMSRREKEAYEKLKKDPGVQE
jgi:hypothetical protein